MSLRVILILLDSDDDAKLSQECLPLRYTTSNAELCRWLTQQPWRKPAVSVSVQLDW